MLQIPKQILDLFSALEQRIHNVDNKYDFPTVRTSQGVSENGAGLIDIADLADENSISIEELAEMLQDHEDRIAALESKEEV